MNSADRLKEARRRIRQQAKMRGISFTKLVKRELPGWPSWNGPKLTAARAEAIADKLERPTQEQTND